VCRSFSRQVVEHPDGHLFAQINLPGGYPPDRVENLPGGFLLGDVAAGARADVTLTTKTGGALIDIMVPLVL
jgi:hypothetical protein